MRLRVRMVLGCAVSAMALLSVAAADAQPGGSTYQRRGSGWGGHQDKWRHQSMPTYSSQTSAGSFQRPYPYHLDYYRARWGGSYAPYFGNLYGPPNFFFGTPFFGGISPWGFGAYPFSGFGAAGFGGAGFGAAGFGGAGFGAGVGGFDSPGWGGGPFNEGGGYGPWQGPINPAMAPMAAPFQGGGMQGAGPGF